MATFFLSAWLRRLRFGRQPAQRLSLSALGQLDETRLPRFVRESAVALKYLRLLGPLDWDHFPDRPDQRFNLDCPPLPYAPLVAAYLVKIDQHLPYLADLREYLVQHPALVWVLGFPVVKSSVFSWGFDVEASLPTHRHLSRMLRCLPNPSLQFLLDETVRLLQADLPDPCIAVRDCFWIANVSGADLSQANLREADLSKADLSGADLSGADLRQVNLSGAYLSEADPSLGIPSEVAVLNETNLSEANLSGVNLSSINLRVAIVSGAKYDNDTKWPRDFDPEKAGYIKIEN